MPEIIGDGMERWDIVTSIANILFPTAAELNSGVRVSPYMTRDGATGFTPETADAPTSNKEATFDTAVNGTLSLSNPRLRFLRQTPLATDPAYIATGRDQEAFLVRRNSLKAATAYANNGQLVDIIPVMFSQKAKLDQDQNQPERYDVPVKLTGEPVFDVAVV